MSGTQHEPTLPDVAVVKRFVVSEDSMRPALAPGDALIAVRSTRVIRGQIRCFEHPQRPGFWLVKRVGGVRADSFEAVSDNDQPGSVDSRTFGFVAVSGTYRVLMRIPFRMLR